MPKNIVVCLEGTAGEYGTRKSNVVRLYSMLTRDTRQQLAFYAPGVGTLTSPLAWSAPWRTVVWLLGLMFGYGMGRSVREAYLYLMQTYEPGDRIYLFGFSRGAYAARVLAGFLHKCGLLFPFNDNLIPYAWKVFKHHLRTDRFSNGFRATFAQRVQVHFLGLWDTVSSVGWIYDPVSMAHTTKNPSVRVVRHAVSIHERRCFYRQNLWSPTPRQDVKEVWFNGDHCDVGGSYPQSESGLSQVALSWMVDEAEDHGLIIDERARNKMLPEQPPKDPERPFPPDIQGPIHTKLRGPWWILEWLPKRYADRRDNWRKKFMLPRGRPRVIAEHATLHWSVVERKGPRATNLPTAFAVEERAVQRGAALFEVPQGQTEVRA